MAFTAAPQIAVFSQTHGRSASVSGAFITHSTQGMSRSFDCAEN
jgi:hypothetical protein